MEKIIITVGLPGSGKTTFASDYKNEMEKRFKHVLMISLDEFILCKNENETKNYIENNLDKVISKSVKRNLYAIVIDGLLLTNWDVIRAVNVIGKYYSCPIEIMYWDANREACLENDKGRREKSSATIIQKAKIEHPKPKFIKEHSGYTGKISVIEKQVYQKAEWERFAEDKGIAIQDKKFLYSETYSLGGVYGNCWDNSMNSTEPDEIPKDFKEFDDLLISICPDVSFLVYKKLYNECVTSYTWTESEYYGGHSDYFRYKCDIEKLFDMMEQYGLIKKL